MPQLQSCAAREGVRRIRSAIAREDRRFVWLLGAGCSVSSGVPAAAALTRDWLRRLKIQETGSDLALEPWVAMRFPGYDPADPAACYGAVFEAIAPDDSARRRELQRLLLDAAPGFAYATLAQLLTHEKWGRRANLAVTVNFDDLLGDALYVYARQRPPRILHYEPLGFPAPLGSDTATVVKILGDPHPPPGAAGDGPKRLMAAPRRLLRGAIAEAGLIVAGYGGRDASVLDLLEGLPRGTPAGGVYWFDDQPPRGAFADWLAARGGIWVPHADFDELMYLFRLEFGLSHPRVDRMELFLNLYARQYRAISTRSGRRIGEDGVDWAALEAEATETLEEQPAESSEAALLRDCAGFALAPLEDAAAAERFLARALDLTRGDSETLCALAEFVLAARADGEAGETAEDGTPLLGAAHARALVVLAEYRRPPAEDLLAVLLALLGDGIESVDRLYRAALILDPASASAMRSYADFLEGCKGDGGAAASWRRRADEIDPREQDQRLGA